MKLLCCSSHRMQDCPDRSNMFEISKEKKAKPVESEALKLESMILNFIKTKRNCKQKGLMYVDINIAG